MNRRKFLSTLIGGVATAAAVRTFPFRVYSFPSNLGAYPGRLCTPTNWTGVDLGFEPGQYVQFLRESGVDYRVNEYLPDNEVWLVRETKRQILHVPRDPRPNFEIASIFKSGAIIRLIDLVPSDEKELWPKPKPLL